MQTPLETASTLLLSLDEAVALLAPAYDLAIRAGVPIIRMGLQADPALEKPGVILAGPYHPAFGCLVKCRWWQDRIDGHLASLEELLRAGNGYKCCAKPGERRYWTPQVKSAALENEMGHKREGGWRRRPHRELKYHGKQRVQIGIHRYSWSAKRRKVDFAESGSWSKKFRLRRQSPKRPGTGLPAYSPGRLSDHFCRHPGNLQGQG